MSSIKDLKSMCANTPCRDCRLLSWCESRDRISELPDDMDEVVDAYVRNHPPKTYAMDFLGKLKHLYEMIFKLHCPECNCVMDCEGLCEFDKLIYKCRGCGKVWI